MVQDKKSKRTRPAAGPTALEFTEEVMKPTMEAANKLLRGNPEFAEYFPEGASVLYSFDSARIHQSALSKDKEGKSMLGAIGFDAEQHRVPLPPYSPDMHKVIEHAHGRAVNKFQDWLYKTPGPFTMKKYKKQFEKIFKECCTPSIVSADVDSLKGLYNEIRRVQGQLPARQMR